MALVGPHEMPGRLNAGQLHARLSVMYYDSSPSTVNSCCKLKEIQEPNLELGSGTDLMRVRCETEQ